MAPKQRRGGESGNTDWGHRLNRVHSSRRGGNAHAKRGKKKAGCFGVLFLAVAAGTVLTDLAVNHL